MARLRWSLSSLALVGLVGATVTVTGPPARPVRARAVTPAPEAFSLEHPPGCPRRLPPQGDAYEIDLPADRYLHTVFDQQGTDLAITVFAPGHRRLYRVDSPNGDHGPEEVYLVSGEAGRYRFEVTGPPGDYCPQLREVRPPSLKDRHRAAADQDLYPDPDLPTTEKEKRYRQAIPLLAETGERWQQAVALERLTRFLLGDHCEEAIPRLAQAEELFEAEGYRKQVLSRRIERGVCQSAQFDFEPALKTLESAADLALELKDVEQQAFALHAIGMLYQARGETWQALHRLSDAIDLWQRLPGPKARENEANSLTARGWVYDSTGDWKRALADHRRAFRLRMQFSSPDKQAVSALQIGSVLRHMGIPGLARSFMEKAAKLQSGSSSEHDRAATLNGLGLVLDELGRHGEAQIRFQEALSLYSAGTPNRFGQAQTLIHLGTNALKLGARQESSQRFEQALQISRQTKNPGLQVRALEGLAMIELLGNHLATARAKAEEAVALCEKLRIIAVRPDLQTASTADHFAAYRLLIRILMEQNRRDPRAGHDREAFERSEQARARSLLDALRESRSQRLARQAGVSAELLAELQAIRVEIDRLLRLKNRPDADLIAIDRKFLELFGRENEIKVEIQRSRGPAPPASPPFDWEQARQSLGTDTLLLEYSFGPQSYLWAVSADGLRSFSLPPGRELEPLLRATVEKLGKGEPTDDDALDRLSHMLLGPVAGLLRGKHLLIAADGGAQYLPFAVLPDPDSPPHSPRPLLVDHEIDSVPSLSALAELRERRAERAPAPLPLALLADPVFSQYDQRLPPGAAACDPSYLSLLPQAPKEAKKIAALLPPGEVLLELGFDTARERVLAGSLSRYRYLHFATHGRLDTEHPELSSLVLSRYDRQGRCIDGDLRVSDIQNLDLPADLAVLSACETALGRETPGEGLVGLPQAFLTAGATSVVVSLWNVEDGSTAALMTELYRQLLREHQPPGQALRAAQLAIRNDSRWGAPRYWAPFVLQGDWR